MLGRVINGKGINQGTDSLLNVGWLELSLKIGNLPQRLLSLYEGKGKASCHSKQKEKKPNKNIQEKNDLFGLWFEGGWATVMWKIWQLRQEHEATGYLISGSLLEAGLACPEQLTSSSYSQLLKDPQASPNHVVSWEPSVQTHDPVRHAHTQSQTNGSHQERRKSVEKYKGNRCQNLDGRSTDVKCTEVKHCTCHGGFQMPRETGLTVLGVLSI